MPEQDADATEVHEPKEVAGVALAIRAVERNQFDFSLFAKLLVERIAVIGSVSNKEIGLSRRNP
jgi:hypothetical protein